MANSWGRDEKIKPVLDHKKQMIIFIAAGIKCEQMNGWLNKGDGVLPCPFNVIPNIAIAVKEYDIYRPMQCEWDTDRIRQTSIRWDGRFAHCRRTTHIQAQHLHHAGSHMPWDIRASVEGGVELGFKGKGCWADCTTDGERSRNYLQTNGNHPKQK